MSRTTICGRATSYALTKRKIRDEWQFEYNESSSIFVRPSFFCNLSHLLTAQLNIFEHDLFTADHTHYHFFYYYLHPAA
jgi:hypothetical protein